MIDASAAPARVGLCPAPEHYGEFYLPLDATGLPTSERAICPVPGCNTPLLVYTREADFEAMPEDGWQKGHAILWKRRWPGVVVDLTDGRPGTPRRYLVNVKDHGLMDLPGEDLVHERRGRQRRET